MTLQKKILLVDDEHRLLDSMAQRISLLGFEPITCNSGIKAIEIIKKNTVDLAIVDLKMPDMDGLVTIAKLKEIQPNLKTVLLTGYGSEKTKQTTQAIGALYVEKDEMGELWNLIKQSTKKGKVVVIKPLSGSNASSLSYTPENGTHLHQVEISDSAPESAEAFRNTFKNLPKIIGEAGLMQRLQKNILRVSELDCTVLLNGEPGTGKELTARTIHKLGRRSNEEFIAFDCGCFSNDFHFFELIRSYKPQEYHSQSNNPSKKTPEFRGTILLDHIENMPRHTQLEMLNILNEKFCISPDNEKIMLDIRFIVASHHDLKNKVKEKKISKTLLHKIQGIELTLPPLRNRQEDIETLCNYFILQFNKEFGKNIKSISSEVLSLFNTYPFPGNIRELKQIMERAVLLAQQSTIEPHHLPDRLNEDRPQVYPAQIPDFLTLHDLEQQHILKAIELTSNNKSKAAEILGISRAALWRKLKLINQNTID